MGSYTDRAAATQPRSGLLGFLVELGQIEILELLQVLGRQAAHARQVDGPGLVFLGVARAGAELLRAVFLGRREQAHLRLELVERVILASATRLERVELGLERVAG